MVPTILNIGSTISDFILNNLTDELQKTILDYWTVLGGMLLTVAVRAIRNRLAPKAENKGGN